MPRCFRVSWVNYRRVVPLYLDSILNLFSPFLSLSLTRFIALWVKRGTDRTKKTSHIRDELSLPHTSPHVSLKHSSHCLPIYYLSLSFRWMWAKSLCFLCMLAMDLQGNQCRRLQCTTPYVITALIKTITAAHSFHSASPSPPIWMHIFTAIPWACEASNRTHTNEVCTVYGYEAQCVCSICGYAHLLQVNGSFAVYWLHENSWLWGSSSPQHPWQTRNSPPFPLLLFSSRPKIITPSLSGNQNSANHIPQQRKRCSLYK